MFRLGRDAISPMHSSLGYLTNDLHLLILDELHRFLIALMDRCMIQLNVVNLIFLLIARLVVRKLLRANLGCAIKYSLISLSVGDSLNFEFSN
jgi:hypothetical protein